MERVIRVRRKSKGLLTEQYTDEYEATLMEENRSSIIANTVALLSVLLLGVQCVLIWKQAEIAAEQTSIAAKTQRLVSDPGDFKYLENLKISRTRHPASETNLIEIENFNRSATTDAAMVIQGVANVESEMGRVDRALLLAYVPLDVVGPCQKIEIPVSSDFLGGWRLYQSEYDGNDYSYSAFEHQRITEFEIGTLHLSLRGGYRWWTLTEQTTNSNQSIRRYSEVGLEETASDTEFLELLEDIPEDDLIGDTIAESVDTEYKAIRTAVHSANPVVYDSPEQPLRDHYESPDRESVSSSEITGCR